MPASAVNASGLTAGLQPFNPLGTMNPVVDSPADPVIAQNRQNRKEASLANAGDTATRNPGALQVPVCPDQVMEGTIIATVTEAVDDTATGPHLLIPRGARLIGRYDSQVAFGQRRVLLVWIRLILPDTSSVALGRLPGIGSPVRVMVNKDLILRSYQPLFFKRGSSQ